MINDLVLNNLENITESKLKKVLIAGGLAALGGGALAIRHADKKLEKSRNRKILGLTAAGAVGLGIAKSAENGALNTLYHLHKAKKYNDITNKHLQNFEQEKNNLAKAKEESDSTKIIKSYGNMTKSAFNATGHNILAKKHMQHIEKNNSGFLNDLLKNKIQSANKDINSYALPTFN